MPDRKYNVLFLCTGNSARSIMAEAIINFPLIGGGKFKGYSAGSFPTGEVNPYALKTLQRHRIPTQGLRSKNWDEFAANDALRLDYVFTVCDNAAGEVCPVWPGHPVSAHWGVEDPAAVEGSEKEISQAFNDVFLVLRHRVELLAALPFEKLDKLTLNDRLREIGTARE